MTKDPTGFSFLLSLVMVFAVMYFMILRPQSKRQKQRELMLKQVKKGDQVLTTGGLYVTVLATKGDDRLVVKIGDTTRADLSRAAVQQVVASGAAEE